MKQLNEWSIPAPWGSIVLVSWGNPAGEPVLLVHGRQDSAATFLPLLQYLPEDLYYVGVDMPGNGKSDPFPAGVKLGRFHFVGAVEAVIKHLGWKTFIYIGHSMGCEQGLFFNAVYPHRIKRAVYLDLLPSLQRLQIHDLVEYYHKFYYEYYKQFKKINFEVKTYTKREALTAVMRARGLTEEQADLILSRNLKPVENDKYRLSWSRHLYMPAPPHCTVEFYIKLFSINPPPSLLISASQPLSDVYSKGEDDALTILRSLQKMKILTVVKVEGGHDVHFTNPERMGKVVNDFLRGETVLNEVQSKL